MRLMNHVLRDHIGRFVVIYFDDILVYSNTLGEHLGHLRQVLSILRDNHLSKSVGEVRSFHGLTSFYRRFVKDFSTLASPLNELVKKDVPFIWGEELEKAFEKLKEKLTNAPILALPKFSQTF
uniref:Retrotransposon-like protein 1 n=1 Tax=Cajanus cajan TaxID=3821 RepID=A0A151TSP9_CAJCA|nr:Retrotransposon-like protein 1 [Cajanus cajan]